MAWRCSLFLVTFLMTSSAGAQHAPAPPQPTLSAQNSGTKNALIAVSALNERVAWASGRNGTFTVTTDGGATWHAGVIAGAETLQLRDVEAVSDKVAYALSIGDHPSDFRIYKTTDGGATWTMQFQNQNAKAFYDCFAFWTPARGIAVSDSVSGVFPDMRTTDGKTWQSISQHVPAALDGEGSFASSGTCVSTEGRENAWIATGSAAKARILATRDGGSTWSAHETPLASAQGAGAFTVAFRDAKNGMIGGGSIDPKQPNAAATAVSRDGGKTWALTTKPPVTGAIYGLSYVSRERDRRFGRAVVITANEGGAAWTPDEGATWFKLPEVQGYWGVAFANARAGWLVGTDGRILKISF